MTDNNIERSLSEQQIALEGRKVVILESAEERAASEPKPWNSSKVTIVVALFPILLGVASIWSEHQQTKRATDLNASLVATENARNDTQKEIENARTATGMYFDNLNEFVCTNKASALRAIAHMNMISTVSGHDGVRDIFKNLIEECSKFIGPTASAQGEPIGTNIPSVSTSDELEVASGYMVFIQYPRNDECNKVAAQLQSQFSALGFRTPGIEGINAELVPEDDEIRFYSNDQMEQWTTTWKDLLPSQDSGFNPDVDVLSGNLPDDIFEVWIGVHNECYLEQD